MTMMVNFKSEVEHRIFCISDIYITVHNSSKITVMKSKENYFQEELNYREAALGRLRTTTLNSHFNV